MTTPAIIYAAYESGLSYDAIGARYGLTKGQVAKRIYNHRRETGIKPEKVPPKNVRKSRPARCTKRKARNTKPDFAHPAAVRNFRTTQTTPGTFVHSVDNRICLWLVDGPCCTLERAGRSYCAAHEKRARTK